MGIRMPFFDQPVYLSLVTYSRMSIPAEPRNSVLRTTSSVVSLFLILPNSSSKVSAPMGVGRVSALLL